MGMLDFETIINLTESEDNPPPKYVNGLITIHEPTGELHQYYMLGSLLFDKSVNENNSYENLKWSEQDSHITTKDCLRFGVKHFPGVGATAFYTDIEGNSKILCPVYNHTLELGNPPTLKMTVNENSLTFTITSGGGFYKCYRIVLRNGKFAYEYIIYGKELTVTKPDVKGEYTIYCIGYKGDGSGASSESNKLQLIVNEGQDTFEPTTGYYTKDQIDKMIGDIGLLLDRLNGEVI